MNNGQMISYFKFKKNHEEKEIRFVPSNLKIMKMYEENDMYALKLRNKDKIMYFCYLELMNQVDSLNIEGDKVEEGVQ